MSRHEQFQHLNSAVEGAMNGSSSTPVSLAHRLRLAWAIVNLYSYSPKRREDAATTGEALVAAFPEGLQRRFGDCVHDGQANGAVRAAFGHAGFPEGFLSDAPYSDFQRQYLSTAGPMESGSGAFRPLNDLKSAYLNDDEAHDLSCAIQFHYQEGLWREEAEDANQTLVKLGGREKVEWLTGLLAGSPPQVDFLINEAGQLQFDVGSMPYEPEPSSGPSV